MPGTRHNSWIIWGRENGFDLTLCGELGEPGGDQGCVVPSPHAIVKLNAAVYLSVTTYNQRQVLSLRGKSKAFVFFF